ncbi:MAG: hypothetical protein IPH57_07260 [Saprospiraceae bacterium]|nr:hypothetical protein [Saprospiraceae bacterium]
MKNLFFTLLLLFSLGFNAFASDADLFKLDYNAVQTEFTELNQLGDMVASNPEITYSSLVETNGNLVTSINLAPESALPMGSGNQVLGIPSFLWGCVFSVAGLLVVYISTEQDKEETKKAFYGCLANGIILFCVPNILSLAGLFALPWLN